ncbi:hypothetical protein ACFCYB_05235 [Streptomyces sp. NPDC056309]|uniref:hypothetical protein n=1 Tax=unclassified Streptomyces TaxID=2593676 RepID=UPI0035E0E192
MGEEGVSLTEVGPDGAEHAATVPYRACAAMLSWPDGGRRLIGTDGLVVDMEPGLYGVDAHTMAVVAAAVPPAVVVWLPPRERTPASEPVPGPGGGGAIRAGSPGRATPTRRTGGQTAALVVFGLLGALFGFLALSFTVFGADDPETSTGELISISGFMWGLTALLTWPAVRILRRTRRV